MIGEQTLRKCIFGVALLSYLFLYPACQQSKNVTTCALKQFSDLAGKGVRIGIVDPDLGPAGRYALDVIKKVTVADAVAGAAISANIVTHESHVRALLDKLKRREIDAGFIYRSDYLTAAKSLNIIEIPLSFAVSPEYALARIKSTSYPQQTLTFINWLTAPARRKTWLKYGFKPRPVLAPASADSPSAEIAAVNKPVKLTVFAAAVFYDVLSDLAQQYTDLSGVDIICEFAGSGKLFQKIEQGAQGRYGADIFLSADPRYVVALEGLGLADQRRIFMRNDLVVGVVKP